MRAAKKKSRRRECKSQPDVLPERFEKFWVYYRAHVPPDRRAGNRQDAIRAWDKLSPDDELASVMARSLAQQVATQAWATGIGIPYASTWLNNRGWEDDWGPVAETASATEKQEEGEWL